jgi:hypothetical protein
LRALLLEGSERLALAERGARIVMTFTVGDALCWCQAKAVKEGDTDEENADPGRPARDVCS